ncbi:hypothetical protein WJX81_002855 [Elliptochloris bilobata]|uniref:Uncharacterized protein n=1 Tax=Elliptochloris bilobata TaxID=381761 RepID=A0AAW1S3I4_9CHLO
MSGMPPARNVSARDDKSGAKAQPHVTISPKHDTNVQMLAAEWHGAKSIKVNSRPKVLVTDPDDVVLKVTSTCICGSDLHLYLGVMPGMHSGMSLGHEFMGIVESKGPNVKNVKAGDRVVSSFDIACGQCFFCEKGSYSACDTTNNSEVEGMLYGHKTAGFHGYSDLTGGWEGGQAEFARVPFGDMNLLKVPDNLTDDEVVLLSDVLPTAWHACELGFVGDGDIVAIWGAGPVGMLAAHCAKARGAARVILIDNVADRLSFAQAKIPGLEVIDFGKEKTLDALKRMTEHGPDVCIEAVGFHYCKTMLSRIQMALKLETDPSEILNELIYSCRKAGRISIVGVYSGFTNGLNIGAFMEKGLCMRAGQTPVQKYWHALLKMIQEKKLDPTIVITHHMPLAEATRGYKIFNDKKEENGALVQKVVLRTPAAMA